MEKNTIAKLVWVYAMVSKIIVIILPLIYKQSSREDKGEEECFQTAKEGKDELGKHREQQRWDEIVAELKSQLKDSVCW